MMANFEMDKFNKKNIFSILFGKNIFEKKVNTVVDAYMKLVGTDVCAKEKKSYKANLQKDFLNYIKSNEINVEEINTAENIKKTAFLRLKFASENYCTSKQVSNKESCSEELKKKAQQMKSEYELISSLL